MADIKNLTLKELITERSDLVQAIKNGEDENETASHVEKDKKGRVKKWTEETKDLDGILISKRVDEYSYYKTGEVDIITQQVYDSKGELVSEKKVKHFVDGRRPEVK
jgi:Mg2+/Co2+ transporter CorB